MKLTLEQAQEMMSKRKGNLDLINPQITSLPDNLTVGGWLNISNTQITSLPDNLTVGGSLDISNTQITSLPDNLTVGGSLDISNTQITSLPDNLTVGGWLNISNTQITSLPDNLTVGSEVYVKNSNGKHYFINTEVKKLHDGDYVAGEYLYADGILIHCKTKRHIDGYDLYIGKIKGQNCVSDGQYYAHCNTLRDGIKDIAFKRAKDRGAEQYSNMTLDTVVTKEEAMTMYRIITGACKAGTEQFVNNLKEVKDSFTIREAIKITRGQYNAEAFARFFGVD